MIKIHAYLCVSSANENIDPRISWYKVSQYSFQIEEQFGLSYDESASLNLRFNKEILETKKAHLPA